MNEYLYEMAGMNYELTNEEEIKFLRQTQRLHKNRKHIPSELNDVSVGNEVNYYE